MFRKPPLRTYERKKGRGLLSASTASSAMREDVPDDERLQPDEFLAFKDSDVSLEYDPFDTTFDRLVKSTKTQPPVPLATNYPSRDSSSDEDAESSKLFQSVWPDPMMNPTPEPRLSNDKKRKINEKTTKAQPKKPGNRKNKKARSIDSSVDENDEPNVEKKINPPRRGRKKKDSKESPKKFAKTNRRAADKSFTGDKNKNADGPKNLKRCSVSLMRVPISLDESMEALSLRNDDTNDKQISADKSDPRPSTTNARSDFIDEGTKNAKKIKITKIVKNPMVSLYHLPVRKPGASFVDAHWLSSTPIDAQNARTKSSLRFSPIGKIDTNNLTHDENSHPQTSLPRRTIPKPNDSTPKNSKTSKFDNKKNQKDGKSIKKISRILSDSPESDPSRLLFDDTEVSTRHPDESVIGLKMPENVDKNEKSTMSTIDDVTKVCENNSDKISRFSSPLESAGSIEISKDEVDCGPEASSTSPFMGFTKESTDSGSYRMTLEVSDVSSSSTKSHSSSSKKNRRHSELSSESSKNTLKINLTDLTNDELFHGFPQDRQSTSQQFSQNSENNFDEMTKNVAEKNNFDFEFSSKSSINSSKKNLNDLTNDQSFPDLLHNRPSTSKQISKNSTNHFQESTEIKFVEKNLSNDENLGEELSEDREIGLESSVDDVDTRKSISDGEWMTISESEMEETRDKEESTIDEFPSIVDLRSDDDENDSSYDIGELVEAISITDHNDSNSHDSTKSFVAEESSKIETIDENQTQENKNSSVTKIDEKKMLEHSSRNCPQPIVLLSRVNVPIGAKIISAMENHETNDENDSLNLNLNLNEDEKMENLSSKIEKFDKSMEWQMNENEDSKTSKEIDHDVSSHQPIVLLTRLNDHVRITDRRKKNRNWGLKMFDDDVKQKKIATIAEESDENDDETKETMENDEETSSKANDDCSTKKIMSQATTASCDMSVTSNHGHDVSKDDRMVFLKPGKCWSRSLSLYRQVNSQDGIDEEAAGKGKKWRQSVQNIMDMQQKGVIQSCVKKNADDRESLSCYGTRDTVAQSSSASASIAGCPQSSDATRLFGQSTIGSPGRFVRRVSIRVVPDYKNSRLYEDTPFHEAYGITSCESRKTFDKRSTLIAPRKTLVYNVQCNDVTFESIPKAISSVTSREVVLAQCGQDSSVPFEECYPDSYLKHCRKIGEGVFGEVFLYEKGSTRNVIKIIPIEGDLKVNGERQKKFDEILSEIVIAKELNGLRFNDSCRTSSFVEVKNIRCVVGNYPRKLIDQWKFYDDEKNSENDCPDMFDKEQLYIVLELGHGGQDLEAFVFQNSSEAHALFVQTALALAVAEESLQFEHRDLHWGNLLISRTDDSHIDYKLHDKNITVASKGVKVSVIDFTLSRMSYQGCSIFNDLSLDDDLFAAQGEYQFEIYRLMRQKVENNWQTFEPYTNVLWLHYTLDKMISAVRYRRTSSKIHKNGIDKLKELSKDVLNYDSAYDFVTNCDKLTRLQGSRSRTSTIASAD